MALMIAEVSVGIARSKMCSRHEPSRQKTAEARSGVFGIANNRANSESISKLHPSLGLQVLGCSIYGCMCEVLENAIF